MHRAMVRRKSDGNHSPQSNNFIQYSEGNEENRYSNKTKIKDTKECSNAHKNTLKEEIL
jgi:hypothetical protein